MTDVVVRAVVNESGRGTAILQDSETGLVSRWLVEDSEPSSKLLTYSGLDDLNLENDLWYMLQLAGDWRELGSLQEDIVWSGGEVRPSLWFEMVKSAEGPRKELWGHKAEMKWWADQILAGVDEPVTIEGESIDTAVYGVIDERGKNFAVTISDEVRIEASGDNDAVLMGGDGFETASFPGGEYSIVMDRFINRDEPED